jgi:molybdopterin biosynthesis enzyme
VMIEHTRREGRTIILERAAQAGDHIVKRGSEAG